MVSVRSSLLVIPLLMVLHGSVAWAGPAEAAALDKEAREAFAAGDFQGAAQKFAQAHEAAPHPSTKYNEAMAWEQAGDLARAADAYQTALSLEGLDEERSAAARDRLAELEKSLAILSVTEPAGATVSVGHITDRPVPIRIYVVPGKHEVVIRRPDGGRTVREVDAKAGRVFEVFVEVTKAPKETRAPVVAEPDRSAPPVEETSSASTWGWVAVGTAGACVGAASFLGFKTLDTLDTYEASGYRDADARDDAVSYKRWTNIAWGAAAVTGAVGIVLLTTGSGGEADRDSNVRAQVGVTPGGATMRVRF